MTQMVGKMWYHQIRLFFIIESDWIFQLGAIEKIFLNQKTTWTVCFKLVSEL